MEEGGNTQSSAVEAPRGMYNGRLDDKGRIKIPATFQKYFESLPEKKLFVTSLDRRTAAIYPIATWRAMEMILDNFSEDPDAAEDTAFNANFLGAEVEMDGQGRILFNSELRRVAKLEGAELHLYWYRGHLEVMPDEMFRQKDNRASANAVPSLGVMRKAGLK